MNKAAYLVSFICGVVTGAVVMSIYNDKKKEPDVKPENDIPEDAVEISEQSTITQEDAVDHPAENKVVIKEAVDKIISENGYGVGDHTNPDTDDGPYVIGPADFGDFEDYDAISMTLLADGILVDDRMITVDDPENTVGANYKNYFGVYPNDPDTVYIRNDELCTDFEIVKDLRTYEEVDAQRPHLRWSDNE